MHEHDFDSLKPWRPFTTDETARLEVQWGRLTVLAKGLWGTTNENLERQLLARVPEIPPNFGIADLRKLLYLASLLSQPRPTFVLPMRFSSQPIVVGTKRFTTWEARVEIVRRAIEFLESSS